MSTNYFEFGEFKIVPLRHQDKYKIMGWRNEQLFHLRQKKKLTNVEQDNYFRNVIEKSFTDENPKQILFSFLEGIDCVGYGGLVHINWNIKIAELSFLIRTDINDDKFEKFWNIFIKLIEKVSFATLDFNQIYTVSYNKRPLLYKILRNNHFKNIYKKDFYLKFSDEKSMLVNVKDSNKLKLRKVLIRDSKLLYDWVNDENVRRYSLNDHKISWEEHISWFHNKINDDKTNIYILEKLNKPIGQIRVESIQSIFEISFSISNGYRGQGFGNYLIAKILEINPKGNFKARVKPQNKISKNLFEKFNFRVGNKTKNIITYIYP